MRPTSQRGRQLLLESGWSGICQLLSQEYARGDTPERRSALEKLVGYFAKHAQRLGYRDCLAASSQWPAYWSRAA